MTLKVSPAREEVNVMNWDERTRGYLYRILVAVIGVLIAYGVVTAELAEHWMFLAAALLGWGSSTLASANTKISREEDEPPR